MAQVGLNDLHFAVLTEDTKEVLTYGIPEPMVELLTPPSTPP